MPTVTRNDVQRNKENGRRKDVRRVTSRVFPWTRNKEEQYFLRDPSSGYYRSRSETRGEIGIKMRGGAEETVFRRNMAESHPQAKGGRNKENIKLVTYGIKVARTRPKGIEREPDKILQTDSADRRSGMPPR